MSRAPKLGQAHSGEGGQGACFPGDGQLCTASGLVALLHPVAAAPPRPYWHGWPGRSWSSGRWDILRVSRRPFPVLGRPFEGSLPPVKGRPVWMRRKEKHRCHSRRKHGPCCRSRLDSVLAGTGIAAGAANAANWNIPSNLHYPFFPECNTHMNAYEAGYGTQTCKGEYTVNKSNYMFTQDNADACPALGKVEVAMLSP